MSKSFQKAGVSILLTPTADLLLLFHALKILAVQRLADFISCRMYLFLRQQTALQRNFLQTRNVSSGAVLNLCNTVCREQQAVRCTGIHPYKAALKRNHIQLAAAQIFQMDIRDLILSACGGLEIFRDFDDLIVIEVQTRNNVIGFRKARFFLNADCLAVPSNSTTPNARGSST